ncbi:hypothetical protein SNEBB_005737 [Seison nebaliae]|nr:hypothetical protein SNEBB_005737 [Seison nebaliae]
MEFLKSFTNPQELSALYAYKTNTIDQISSQVNEKNLDECMKKCYEYLRLTSRSFSAVIQALDEDIGHAVCIFYLVLRALDTVEDDTSLSMEVKEPILLTFHEQLTNDSFYFTCNSKDAIILENFHYLTKSFKSLKEPFQEIISDICQQMAKGMIHFLTHDVVTIEDWEEYCHYVAGLVGHGLSRLFAESQLENETMKSDDILALAKKMGLFLQKTNIIRDFREDILEKRLFYPKEVWNRYVDKPEDLLHTKFGSLNCLNELISNSLAHIPQCIDYLHQLQNQSIFNFCAIPQVMAIATLERCFNNPKVFQQNVKIRKGETVLIIQKATNLYQVQEFFLKYLRKIEDQSDQIFLKDERLTKEELMANKTVFENNLKRALKSCTAHRNKFNPITNGPYVTDVINQYNHPIHLYISLFILILFYIASFYLFDIKKHEL